MYTSYRREVYLCNCLKIKVIYKKEPYFWIVFFQNLASAFMHSLLKLLILQLTSLLYWSSICTYSAKIYSISINLLKNKMEGIHLHVFLHIFLVFTCLYMLPLPSDCPTAHPCFFCSASLSQSKQHAMFVHYMVWGFCKSFLRP